jgi:hypothetical protein
MDWLRSEELKEEKVVTAPRLLYHICDDGDVHELRWDKTILGSGSVDLPFTSPSQAR